MRDYEIVYIFRSTLEPEEIDARLEALQEPLISEGSGEITAAEHWGKRQLAYEIEDERNGYYVVVQFRADPAAISGFEARLGMEEDLLRHLIVLSEGELPTPPSMRDEDDEDEEDEDEDEDEEEEGDAEEEEEDDESADEERE